MSENQKDAQIEEAQECTHDCSTCGSACSSRTESQSLLEKPNQLSKVGKVIAVVSGKGGVGKSLVSSMLAVGVQRAGKHAAILDADITGPSIPKAFGVKGRVLGNELGMLPAKSKMGIDIMSVNLMLEHDTDPVVWRGPVIAGVVKQFWTDVIWDDVDYMFVDMPPGTGDVPLTVFQSIPVDGIVIVTSPQDLVSMIVQKAVKMANMMNIPVLGIVENMSYAVCPDCGKKIMIYGESHTAEIAKDYNIPLLAQIPFDPSLTKCCDLGVIELHESVEMDCAVAKIMGE
ncbi:MAG: Mrp/NBP35 family ATP-binding protein [Oscillospiraceae bacterium]|nr:Mrp/NBP35 family ATP-binding protein [Oscillospiraceae bacterium]